MIAKNKEIKYEYINPFEPMDWQIDPWNDTSPVILLTGSAGGGKSRLAAEKIHAYLLRYPYSTGLIVRKVRAVMSNSTIVFMKSEIIGKDPRVKHLKAEFRFEYDNGSMLAYGGMKDDEQRERIRSIGLKGGLDIVWMEEATEFVEQDYNEILARMRGNAAPWRQIILTTNPDAPGHWINVRLIIGGEASTYKSTAADNKYNPDDYKDKLKKLSGVQYRRLVLGEWAAGSGRVFDTWEDDYNKVMGKDHGGNVSERAEYVPGAGPVIWAIDDGYSGKMDEKTKMFTGTSHPRAILFAQIDSTGRINVFAESFKIETLAVDHIAEALAISRKRGWDRPQYVVRDRAAASLDGACKEFGLRTKYNQVPVDESIKELRTWIAADDNGYRRVLVHPRCFYLRYEALTFSYDSENRIIKQHDNGLDALRYLTWDQAYGKAATVDIATLASVMERV
jgi:hypothetical protein